MAESLRKRTEAGNCYTRPAAVEAAIDALDGVPLEEVVSRAQITNRDNPEYIQSECLLYLLRQTRTDPDQTRFEGLFRALRQRVLRALPPVDRYASGTTGTAQSAAALDIRDAVLGRFQEMLCRDRSGYEDRLDYFEIAFDGAVASLRKTARKKVFREEARSCPLTDAETSEPSQEVEAALNRFIEDPRARIEDDDYRRRVLAAIDTLPDDQRRVMELLQRGMPIDSKEAGVVTMVQVLRCSEKTVRNRRDRAIAAVQALLAPVRVG